VCVRTGRSSRSSTGPDGTLPSSVVSIDHVTPRSHWHKYRHKPSKRTMRTSLVPIFIGPQPMCSIWPRLVVRYPAFNTSGRPLRLDQVSHRTIRSQGPRHARTEFRTSRDASRRHVRLHGPRTAFQSMNGMVHPVRPMTPNSSADKGVVSARVCD